MPPRKIVRAPPSPSDPATLGQGLLHLDHLYFNLLHQHLSHQRLALKHAQQDNHAAQNFTGHLTGILSLILSQVQKTISSAKSTSRILQHLQDRELHQNPISQGLNFSLRHPQTSLASVTKRPSVQTATILSTQTS